jgi:cyclophilin family peptidyl-prolyl cis-trans isomerase
MEFRSPMNIRPWHFALVFLFVAGLAGPYFVVAQDDDAKSDVAKQSDAKSAEVEKEKTNEESPDEEWAQLVTRRQEISDKLALLRKNFSTANDSDKRAIQTEYVSLISEFEFKVEPRMTELAADRFNKDEKDQDAGEFLLKKVFAANQFARAVEIADKLMQLDEVTPITKNVAGISHYAVNDFEKAEEILKAAEEAGDLDGQQRSIAPGARFLTAAGEYREFWKKEQEIRKKEAEAPDAEKNPVILMKTSKGDLEIELFENEAPNTVANFIELTEKKVYDGLKFHRVIANFMIQGGDPNSGNDDPLDDGQGGPGHTIKCECYGDNARMHFAGTLSMAHAGRDSGGSQFFVTHLPTAHLNGLHTAFGRVTKGLDVVAAIEKDDKIESVTVVRKRDHEYKAEKTLEETPETKSETKSEETPEKKSE